MQKQKKSASLKSLATTKAGLYIHVPFCPRICHYCDFAVLKAPSRMHSSWLQIMEQEMELRSDAFADVPMDSLYWGGGTPGVLNPEMTIKLAQICQKYAKLSNLKEWTIETNPELVTPDRLQCYQDIGVNRISMGIQSLDDSLLQNLGRGHNREQALGALKQIQQQFPKVTIDLMFGLPNQTLEQFEQDLKQILDRGIAHISFYGLTIEDNTLLAQKESQCPEDFAQNFYQEMYERGVELCEQYGLNRYEVSNFAKPGHEAYHNTKYWNHIDYWGVGVGAHSRLSYQRMANPTRYADWQKSIQNSQKWESETLSEDQILLEKVMLGLRQTKGIKDPLVLTKLSRQKIEDFVYKNWLKWEGESLKLDQSGWVYMDEIIADIF